MKQRKNFRLTPEIANMLNSLACIHNITETEAVEEAIRTYHDMSGSPDQPPNIYRHVDDPDRYAVCVYDRDVRQYRTPLTAAETRASGHIAEFAKRPESLGNMPRAMAYYKANKLYGYAKIAR